MAKQPRPTLVRPILVMAAGKVMRMGDIPMREQVAKYLHRLRYTLPFPCTPDEAYFGCVPDVIRKWHDDGLFEGDRPLPGKANNLLLTMFQTSEKRPLPSSTRDPDILHVCVEPLEQYLEATRGARGFEKVFWFRAPSHVPLPRNSQQTPFFLNADHPKASEIHEWATHAFEIENEIDRAMKIIDVYSKFVSTAAQVRYTWPELLNFVTFKRMNEPLPFNERESLKMKAARVMRPADKEHLITQLTTAAMLPERNPPLTAWVNFYTFYTGEDNG